MLVQYGEELIRIMLGTRFPRGMGGGSVPHDNKKYTTVLSEWEGTV